MLEPTTMVRGASAHITLSWFAASRAGVGVCLSSLARLSSVLAWPHGSQRTAPRATLVAYTHPAYRAVHLFAAAINHLPQSSLVLKPRSSANATSSRCSGRTSVIWTCFQRAICSRWACASEVLHIRCEHAAGAGRGHAPWGHHRQRAVEGWGRCLVSYVALWVSVGGLEGGRGLWSVLGRSGARAAADAGVCTHRP